MRTTPLNLQLPDSAATEALGRALAGSFTAAEQGAVIHLRGELGSGKTTCARSLLHALGVTATVRSPTYTLVDTYSAGSLTLVHVDLYRIQSVAEVDELGLRDLFGPECLMLIEWPEKGAGAVPRADVLIQLRHEGESRGAALVAAGRVGEQWLAQLAIDTSLNGYVANLA